MFTGLESPTHLLIILMVILLFFGGKRIPELAKGLGKGMRDFRKGLEEGNETHDEEERERQSGTGESNTGQGHSSST
jgi:sec-independent protein translocase protein TatA